MVWSFAVTLALSVLVCTGTEAGEGSVKGELRIHDLKSEAFGNHRKLRVWLPPGYDAPENCRKRYPALYLNDGQTLFDSAASTLKPLEWEADETAFGLIKAGIVRPLIMVGIDNAGRSERANEYLPYYDEFLEPPLPSPRGSRFPRFVLDEVIPFVDARYRTIRDRTGRGLGGASYGALAALYTVVQAEGEFGYLLLESPSLYVQDVRVLRASEELNDWPDRIFIGVGTNEEGRSECDPDRVDGEVNKEILRDVRNLQGLLKRKGIGPRRLLIEVEPCGEHSEIFWGNRFERALSFLFPGAVSP